MDDNGINPDVVGGPVGHLAVGSRSGNEGAVECRRALGLRSGRRFQTKPGQLARGRPDIRDGVQPDLLPVLGCFADTLLDRRKDAVGERLCPALLLGATVAGHSGIPLARIYRRVPGRGLCVRGQQGSAAADVGDLIVAQLPGRQSGQLHRRLEGVQGRVGRHLLQIPASGRSRVTTGHHLGRHVRQMHRTVAAAGAVFTGMCFPGRLVVRHTEKDRQGNVVLGCGLLERLLAAGSLPVRCGRLGEQRNGGDARCCQRTCRDRKWQPPPRLALVHCNTLLSHDGDEL